MPFALLVIGLILVIVGFQNTYQAFGAQVVKDFTGQNSFIWYLVVIGIVGGIGYIKDLQGFSRAFMSLILVAIFLSNKGFFAQFNSAITSGSSAAVDPVGAPVTGTGGSSSSSGSGGGNSQDLLSAAELGASLLA